MTLTVILFACEEKNMKHCIATMAILATIAASVLADFASDVNFLTNGVLGGGEGSCRPLHSRSP